MTRPGALRFTLAPGRRPALFAAVALAALSIMSVAAPAQNVARVGQPSVAGIPSVSPESVGMSAARLELLTRAFDKEIRDKQVPGAVVLVARKGRLVYAHAFGQRDPARPEPMQINSIFRIYSMTKAMASVAAMMLVEDGVLQLGDPVSKWLPAFAGVKVATNDGLVNPQRAMTVQDLLRHTAGLPYGELTANASVKQALATAGIYKPGVIDFDIRDLTAADFTERLAKVPLIHQPGTTWEYSLATDLLGRVVEAAAGKRLSAFLDERVYKPLGMNDTAFHVPAEKLTRLAGYFEKDPVNSTPFRLIDVSKPPGNDSGGAGAVSTPTDYLRFTQMLLNGGVLNGKRILSRTTVRYMSSDHLGSRIQLASTPGGGVLANSFYTFGLGFAVRPGDGVASTPGSAGDYNWAGYAGTYFWIDPKEQLTAVLMTQSPGARRLVHRNMVRQLVYQAIVD